MASAHFSLSLQQICQSCSETSLISPACSAWHSNPTYRGHAGASDDHSSTALRHPTQARSRRRPQPFQLFQLPCAIGKEGAVTEVERILLHHRDRMRKSERSNYGWMCWRWRPYGSDPFVHATLQHTKSQGSRRVGRFGSRFESHGTQGFCCI